MRAPFIFASQPSLKLAERPCVTILVYHGNAQRRTSRGVDVDCGPPRIFWPEPSRRLAASGALCRMSQHLLLTSSVLSRDRCPLPHRVRHRGPRRAAAPPAGVRCTIHHSTDSALRLFAQRCSVGLNLLLPARWIAWGFNGAHSSSSPHIPVNGRVLQGSYN